MLSVTVVILASIVSAAPSIAGTGSVVVHLPFREWGMAPSYSQRDVELICAGHFEGEPERLAGPVRWVAGGMNAQRPDWVPSEATFRIDSVVLGPQELDGQRIRVRYAVLGELLLRDPNRLLGAPR